MNLNKVVKVLVCISGLTVLTVSFQNCGKGFQAFDASSSLGAPIDLGDPGAYIPSAVHGKVLYDANCMGCHGALANSAVLDKDAARIQWALDNVGPMSGLKSIFTAGEIESIALALRTSRSVTSSFACLPEQKKDSSRKLIRLTGTELKNTYASLFPAALIQKVSAYAYLIPSDEVSGRIAAFPGAFNAETLDALTRYHEHLAKEMAASNSFLASFIGSCATTTSFPKTCFDSFLNSKGARFYRSPLAASDNSRLWAVFQQNANVQESTAALIQAMLNDTRFLFHLELGDGTAEQNGLLALSSYEIANRIAYGMTGKPADNDLWTQALNNTLKDMAVVSAQVDRIAQGADFKNQVTESVKYFVGVRPSVAPSNADFLAGFNANGIEVASENEFRSYINHIVFNQGGSLVELLTSNSAFPSTAGLASVLGTAVSSGGAPVTAPNHRGLLTRPMLLISDQVNTPYIRRALAMRGNLLCKQVPTPNVAEIAMRPQMTEEDLVLLSRRRYIDKSTLAGGTCLVCHSQLNELGYTTGNYDTLGRYVASEKTYNNNGVKVAEHPIDPVTVPNITANDSRSFASMSEFQLELTANPEFSQCMTRRTFQYLEKTTENLAVDSCGLQKMELALRQGKPLVEFYKEKFKADSVLYKKVN